MESKRRHAADIRKLYKKGAEAVSKQEASAKSIDNKPVRDGKQRARRRATGELTLSTGWAYDTADRIRTSGAATRRYPWQTNGEM